ncbi:MAG: F0F1 ATP synthase subunit epsilon [Ferruginibacter sp.]|nr:F0F1 ATP synthase subunit epsilon [Ferruginibacter sp.]
MNLKILLPFKVFADVQNVQQVVAETGNGQFGFLPQRLDCVAALVPGILSYETAQDGTKYIAIDKGILVKAGENITVSVRNAIGGSDLGKLHESVEKEFKELDENEKNVRSVMTKM